MGAIEGFIGGSLLSSQNDVPEPDGSIAQAAGKNMALGDEMSGVARDQLKWNKDQYAELAPYFKQILDQQVKLGNLSADTAAAFAPVGKQVAQDALNEGSTSQQETEANQARSDVAGQFEDAREARGRDLALRGINPASPASMTGLSGANEAAATAGAMNTARNNARLRGIGLRSGAAQTGMAENAQAVSAGSNALNTGTASMTARNAGVASAAPWYSGAVSANTGAGGMNLGVYDANMRGYQAKAQQEAGMYQGLGQLGGMLGYAAIVSSRGVKIRRGALPAEKVAEKVRTLPVDRWKYKDGVADGGEHVGPYAEDFKERFGVGDGKTIKVVDAIGVTLAAVKGLAEKVARVEHMAARAARMGVAHA
jgi:hypothetical protein